MEQLENLNKVKIPHLMSLVVLLVLSAMTLALAYSIQLTKNQTAKNPIAFDYDIRTQAQQDAEIVPDEIIVRFNKGASQEAKSNARVENKLFLTGEFPELDIEMYKVLPSERGNALEGLKRNPNIMYAEPNYHISPAYVPNDPGVTNGAQWQLPALQAETAWDTTTGESAIIAVLDSGVDPNHPDLIANLLPGYNMAEGTTDTTDRCGHGTLVTGIAGAVGNNTQGLAGIAFNAKILPVKVINDYCSGNYSSIIMGIRYAIDHGADVIVISSGGSVYHSGLHDAVKYARANNVLVVAAAGNTATVGPFYPASHPEAIAVSGTTRDDVFYSASTYGEQIDVAAPATPVYTTAWSSTTGSTYANGGGTSFASPHVGGLIALIKSIHPEYTSDQIEYILKNSSDDLGTPGWDDHFGHGRINLARALATTPPPATPTSTPTLTPTITPTPRIRGNTGSKNNSLTPTTSQTPPGQKKK